MPDRKCSKCEQLLPLTAFNRYKDGHQWWCRECFRTYFRERGDLHLEQVAASVAARKKRAQEYILEHLRRHPCIDCDEHDPVVLEFDHVGSKDRIVGVMIATGANPAAIAREIHRCEVVCCNCHRRRTLARKGCERGRQGSIYTQKRFIRRNLIWLYGILRSSGCVDCGSRDSRVLEFDHVGPKRGSVMRMAWMGYGRATLETEVAECEIRCANCHRRKTATRGNHYRHLATLPKPP